MAMFPACGQLPPVTTPQETASISGGVVKQGAPVDGATVVLKQRRQNIWATAAKTRTDASGRYTFNSVPIGNYRVAYVTNPLDKVDEPMVQTADQTVVGFWSTNPFDISSAAPVNLPNFDIYWPASVFPAPNASVPRPSPTNPLVFRWNGKPGAIDYQIWFADSNNNKLWDSGRLGNVTQYSWSGTQVPGPGSYKYQVNVWDDTGFGVATGFFGGTNSIPITLTGP